MKVLLDSHIFLWWSSEPDRLSPTVRALLEGDDTILLSLASVWEMQIKIQLGKLTVMPELEKLLDDQQVANGLELLPITVEHILALGTLPPHHRDPFDRLLIAQAINEEAVLVSADPLLRQYPVQIIR